MSMSLPAGEPAAGPWRPASVAELDLVLHAAGSPQGRPAVVAVDGRGAAGKSTLTAQVQQQATRAGLATAVVHTDDVAWYESFFGWGPLIIEGVLAPLHDGKGVRFQPPAWPANGREGAIEVPAGLDVVLVEGVGAGQRELSGFLDVTVWVQSDFALAEQRGIARDIAQGVNGDREQTIAFWHEWMAEELRFLAEQRPWERACVVVAGTPPLPLEPGQLAIAPGPLVA